MFIAARVQKQLTMSYHMRVQLLCTQYLYAGIRSLTLSPSPLYTLAPSSSHMKQQGSSPLSHGRGIKNHVTTSLHMFAQLRFARLCAAGYLTE